jgi:cytochrome c biogenesis protein
MLQNTKCECGHQNPPHTVLCESCGKPLLDEDGTAPLEMRYDGAARRSQKQNPNLLDMVWNFFSSVKVAVYLIAVTLAVSALGTIYPQESTFYNPELVDLRQYYADEYGWTGELYYLLGLSKTYESWWYRGLLLMIGASLVICSLDRVLPLYRALSKQQIRKHPRFIARQKATFRTELAAGKPGEEERWVREFAGVLGKKGYKVHLDQEGTALLAEKNRFSRWGPYINHIGLIIFLLAALLRTIIPGWNMNVDMQLLEGETKAIPGTPYYLKNEKFTVEVYENADVYKKFETKAVLYRCTDRCGTPDPVLEEVKRHNILMNHPLEYGHLEIFQFHFEQTRQLVSMNVQLTDRASGEVLGTMHLDMKNPKTVYQVGEYEVQVTDYFPEFTFRDGKPATDSRNPRNPAFIFTIAGSALDDAGESYLFAPMMGLMQRISTDGAADAEGRFAVSVASEADVQIANFITYLNVRSEQGMSLIWAGAAISMIGLIMGFYWQHRRIWLRVDDGVLLLGGHTNKNWFALRKEIATALAKTGISVDPKSLSNEVIGS